MNKDCLKKLLFTEAGDDKEKEKKEGEEKKEDKEAADKPEKKVRFKVIWASI